MLAIVPVDAPLSAKRRLEPLLTGEQRAGLVAAMLDDVLEACFRAQSVDRIVVVTPDPALAPRAVDEVLVDPGRGHAQAIASALGRATDGALIVMADCPLVRPETLDALSEAACPIALCPAQDGGTNALALRPADAIQPAFGVPRSAALNVERARSGGFEPAVLGDPLVALDVDTPEDLDRLRELGAGTRTHGFLLVSAPAG